jgi:hypothetical protein
MKSTYIVKIKEKLSLPAGAYYIGDPCYILNSEVYDRILMPSAIEAERNRRNSYEFYSNPNNQYTQRGVVMSTLHGDGCFTSNIGFTFAVDSGQIACIDIACIGIDERIKNCIDRKFVYLYTASKPFDCVRHDNGVLRFNSISINTSDMEESE